MAVRFPMIKNVILDVGRVLVSWDPEKAMRKLGFEEETIKVIMTNLHQVHLK